MMEKRNEAKFRLTKCDKCPKFAEIFIGMSAYCPECYTIHEKDYSVIEKRAASTYPEDLLND